MNIKRRVNNVYLIWKDLFQNDKQLLTWQELHDLMVKEIRDIAYDTDDTTTLRENIDLLYNIGINKRLFHHNDVIDMAKSRGYNVIDIFNTARNVASIYEYLLRKTNDEKLKALSDTFNLLTDNMQIYKWEKIEDKESE